MVNKQNPLQYLKYFIAPIVVGGIFLLLPNLHFYGTVSLASEFKSLQQSFDSVTQKLQNVKQKIDVAIENPQKVNIDYLREQIKDISFQIDLLSKQLLELKRDVDQAYAEIYKKLETIKDPRIKTVTEQNVYYSKNKIYAMLQVAAQNIDEAQKQLTQLNDIITALDILKQLNNIVPMMKQAQILALQAQNNLQRAKEIIRESMNFIESYKVPF